MYVQKSKLGKANKGIILVYLMQSFTIYSTQCPARRSFDLVGSRVDTNNALSAFTFELHGLRHAKYSGINNQLQKDKCFRDFSNSHGRLTHISGHWLPQVVQGRQANGPIEHDFWVTCRGDLQLKLSIWYTQM